MARVGIGIPVYNGGPLLAESLECVRTQTFEDVEVLIGDNASDDETAEICASFAARDSRIRHIRRPINIGPGANFVDLRQQSSADLFMWRAYDDLSDTTYVAELVERLDRDPHADLAVGEIHSAPSDRAKMRVTPYRRGPGGPRIAKVAHGLFRSHASWIYGLWRRDRLAQEQDRVREDYPHDWGWDHLALLPVLLDGAVTGTNKTKFLQRILRTDTTREIRRARAPGLAEMRAIRASYERATLARVEDRTWSWSERAILNLILPFYIDRRAFSRGRLFRRRIGASRTVADS